jgi:hypothetical protein
MRSPRSLTLALLTVAALSLVSGCETIPTPTATPLPPAADLRVEAKPRLAPEDVDSEAALDRHDIALETWGERGWAAVGRLCRWAEANGARGLDCPAPD